MDGFNRTNGKGFPKIRKCARVGRRNRNGLRHSPPGRIMLMGLVAQTEAGDVSVLGTKFLVVQQGKKMLVNCEEGSVKVATPVGQRTLTAGQSVRCDETKIVPVERKVPTPEAEYPEVLGYEDDPLINVVADIEQIFKLTVIGHEKCEGLTYSGTVLTRDLNATLENVFGSSGIGYQLREKEIILE